MRAVQLLQEQGYSLDDIREAYDHEPVPTTRVRRRQASRSNLDDQIRLLAGTIINEHQMQHEGHDLDQQRLGRSNFVVVKARIDTLIRERVTDKDRSEFNQDELDRADAELADIRIQIEREFF